MSAGGIVGLAGASDTPIGRVMNQVMAPIFPEFTPLRTTINMPELRDAGGPAGNGPTNRMWQEAVQPAIAANGGAGIVPFAPFIQRNFEAGFPGRDAVANIAMIDTSHVTTDETTKDMPIENPIWAQPYDDRSLEQYDIYMPLFKLRSDYVNLGANIGVNARVQKMPGFHIVATHVTINQMESQLLQYERDIQLVMASDPRVALSGTARTAAIEFSDTASDVPTDGRMKRQALPLHRLARGKSAQSVSARVLMQLRSLASLDAKKLAEKIEYLGPITQVPPGCGSNPKRGDAGETERFFMYSIPGSARSKIHNIFSTNPLAGDALYFSVGNYRLDQLSSLSQAAPATNLSLAMAAAKRKYSDTEWKGGSAYVGALKNMSMNDSFPQIRGWSSRESAHFMAPIPPTDTMDWLAADRFYVDRERRAALEYVEYDWDAETDTLRKVDNLGDGLQAAIAALPELVLENYLVSTTVIPVGIVKTPINKPTEQQALFNAHYDHVALAAMPHIDIFQNRCV